MLDGWSVLAEEYLSIFSFFAFRSWQAGSTPRLSATFVTGYDSRRVMTLRTHRLRVCAFDDDNNDWEGGRENRSRLGGW